MSTMQGVFVGSKGMRKSGFLLLIAAVIAIVGVSTLVSQTPWRNPGVSVAAASTIEVSCGGEHFAAASGQQIAAMGADAWHQMASTCLYATYRPEGLIGHNHVQGFYYVPKIEYASGMATLHLQDGGALQFPWTGEAQILSECDSLVCSERIKAADGVGAIEICVPASGRDAFWNALRSARSGSSVQQLAY
jgi:hypothetical protein